MARQTNKLHPVKASRYLGLAIAGYALSLNMLIYMLRESDTSGGFWIYFALYSLSCVFSSLAFGEYRHYKRLEK